MTFLESKIRRNALGGLMLNIFIFLAVFISLCVNYSRLPNIIYKPYIVKNMQDIEIANSKKLLNVEINAKYIQDIVYDVKISGKRFIYSYFLIKLEDGYILGLDKSSYLNKSKEQLQNITVKGKLLKVPHELLDSRDVAAKSISESLDKISTFQIDNSDIRDTLDEKMIFLVIFLAGIFSFFSILKHSIILGDYQRHKSFVTLDILGHPQDIERTIDNEYTTNNIYLKSPELTIFKTYLVGYAKTKSCGNILIKLTEDLRMMHLYTVDNRINGIPVGKITNIHLYFKNEKKPFEITCSKKICEEIMQIMEGKLPIVTWYDEEYVKMFSKNPQQFEEIIKGLKAALD